MSADRWFEPRSRAPNQLRLGYNLKILDCLDANKFGYMYCMGAEQ